VEANHTATVRLTGQTTACSPIISHQDARVSGSTLYLSASIENNPVARCAPGPWDYSADFDLPPLAPGEYTVLMSGYPACAYSATPCPFAVPPQDTGRLVAVDPAGLHYRVDPKRAASDRDFRLRLTAPEFQCGSLFTSLTVQVTGHRIQLGFVHEARPEALCPAVVGQYGPVFELSGLPMGVYQVFAAPQPCGPGLCTMAAIQPQLAGAIEVEPRPDKPIWVDPQKISAGSPHSVNLRGTAFACNDVLTDKQTEVKDGILRFRYTLVRTKKLCMVDTIFVGLETFELPALAIGAYPVFLQPMNCEYDSPLCGPGPAAAVDTVYAFSPLGIRNPAEKAFRLRRGDSHPGLRVPWRGGSADLAGRREPAR
jgi:hypothetical protein